MSKRSTSSKILLVKICLTLKNIAAKFSDLKLLISKRKALANLIENIYITVSSKFWSVSPFLNYFLNFILFLFYFNLKRMLVKKKNFHLLLLDLVNHYFSDICSILRTMPCYFLLSWINFNRILKETLLSPCTINRQSLCLMVK